MKGITPGIRRASLATLLLSLLATLPAWSAERAWRRLDAAHYHVYSQLSDRETLAWARDFDQFIASFTGILRIDARDLPPLTVVLFARDKDFEPYKLRKPNGQTAQVAGQFVRQQTWSVIGMPGRAAADQQVRHTIFHEATHWLMSVDEARQPAWFSEGIAELLSTFEIQGKQVTWARPIDQHLGLLDGTGTQPLGQFLTQPGAIFDRDDRTDQFYAQSWAFTHFLLFSGDAARAQLLPRFLEVFKTRSGDATVDEVFGPNLPALEKEFRTYIQNAAYRYTATPAQPTPDLPAPVPASAASVEAALGFLALGARRDELARQHASRAIELDGSAPGGHELLAYLALDRAAYDEASRHAANALKGGSRDSTLYLMLADAFIHGPEAQLPDADRQRANLYEQAINLSPRRIEPYERLAESLFDVEKPREEDAKFLQRGLTVFPGNDWIRVGYAAVSYRLGHVDEGSQAAARALQAESTLKDSQRKFATGFLRSLALQPLTRDLTDAMDRQDVVAIQAAARRLLAEPDLPPDMRASLQRTLDSFDKPPAPPPPPARNAGKKKK